MKKRTIAAVSAGAALTLILAGCAATESDPAAEQTTLVVDSTFALSSMDPARAFEATGTMVNHNVYETALTFAGSDLSTLVPQVADYTISDDNRLVTLTLTGDSTFSDGTAVTADDVVFSYQRLQGVLGNPSFLLDGVTVTKVDDQTVELLSETDNPQLPFILPNPALSILQQSAVVDNGGTLDETDAAETFLTSTSVGSGPYMYDTVAVTTAISLVKNPSYAGEEPYYDRIVINNVGADTQRINLEGGQTDIALNISSDEAEQVDTNDFSVTTGASAATYYLWLNTDDAFGGVAADVNFVKAMRHAIDYDSILDVVGLGSQQPGGVVPLQFAGSLESDENNTYDPDLAEDLLAESGYAGEIVNVLYSSENAFAANVTQIVQANAAAIGVTIELNPQTAANTLDLFRGGEYQAGLANWGADFPDAANYLVFAPEGNIGARTAWNFGDGATADQIQPLAAAAAAASGDDDRADAYIAFQEALNDYGPYIPLFQPAEIVIGDVALTGIASNALWAIDFSTVAGS
ncbi:ABC transporter substrate-binding protein [Cryobacterium melibiosiphilum]|nr:ABC transporter substrate-binding protein [Cryobacterium melibiosiphilum]